MEENKKGNTTNKIIIYICIAICIGATIATFLKPEFVSKFNLLKLFNKEDTIEIANEENEIEDDTTEEYYSVDLGKYYAIAVEGMLDDEFENYFAYTTPEIENGVVDQLGNLTYYFADSSKDYAVLNPEITEPEFYLIVKINEELPEWRESWGFDAGISQLLMRNKIDNSIVRKTYEPTLKFRLNKAQ